METLIAIEAIKVVKAKYFRYVDTRDWDGLRSIFAADAQLDVPEAGTGVRDIEQSLKIFADVLEGAVSVHFGHMPEIEITSPTTARAIWPMDDRIYWSTEKASALGYAKLRGFGHYHETYTRIDGAWRIQTMRLTRTRLITEPPPRVIA
ncbi:nuclear transport factor 2 family protein [Sphingobium sp. R-7]|uniref:nuclear transport factor 2 family protein n=1 Tax=Sphingobium sp. R-7 TaxID=3375449 RepID=UPI00398B8E0D